MNLASVEFTEFLDMHSSLNSVDIQQSKRKIVEEWNAKISRDICCPIAKLFWQACVKDIIALKPGNVHIYADGHNMGIEQFLQSAYAVASVAEDSDLSLAQKIYSSVEATLNAVSTNTNLGIILLCMPIVQASNELPAKTLQLAVDEEIEKLNNKDAQLIFDAIQIASPSGLGKSKQYDVAQPVNTSVRTVMEYAKDRDFIARQYANGFEDIFHLGIPEIDRLMNEGMSEVDSVTALFLLYLRTYPDTHVVRQHENKVAEEVRCRADSLYDLFREAGLNDQVLHQLLLVDADWKRRGINPGTTADMTVATLFAHSIVNGVNYQ